jgi:exopolysaccharide biosynthesis polyprenyl glycosylphosphotransferase
MEEAVRKVMQQDVFIQTGDKTAKPFISRKETLKQKTSYVYCPIDRAMEIGTIVEDYSFDMVVNDFTITDFSSKVFCHFDSARLPDEQREFLVQAMEFGAWVEPLVSYLDSRLGYTEVRLLQSSYFLHQKAFSILSNGRSQMVKRVFDLFIATLALVLVAPICLITAMIIRLESKGPVIFKQLRTGQYNREFKVYKFRSMCTDAEKDGAQWASLNDSRITRVGNFIRKTRIDELPQLINVIKGDMSLVGPRPEREIFIESLEQSIIYYRFRHAVKPGITGLAQVSYPYGASLEDAIWKHKYDIYYIKHHSFWLDLKIILKTIKVVVFGMGR